MNKLIPVISLLAVLMATTVFLTQSDESEATSLGDLSDPKQSIGNEIYDYDSAYLVVGGTLNLSGYDENGDGEYLTWPTGITSGYGFTFTSGSIAFNNTITGTATQTGTVTIQIRYEYPSEGLAGDDTITLYVVPASYVISIESSNTAYGSVSQQSVTVVSGTSISASGSILTIGSDIVMATPSSATAQYSYAFDSWSGIPAGGTVTGDITVTANFTRLNNYTVTVNVNDAGYGSVSQQSVTVVSGTSISASDNVLTLLGRGVVGHINITATSTPADAQYSYAFDSWSGIPAGGTVTGDITVTANFTRTVNQYTVTIVTSPSGYGSVSQQSLTVDYDTILSTNGNVLTIGSTQITATPTTSDAQYTYAFDTWLFSPNSHFVHSDMTVTANFTRTVNQYTVTFDVNNAEYGSVSQQSLTVDYGTSISASGSILTIGSDIVMATPSSATAQYSYAFDSWSGVPATVTGNTTVTADFTRTVNQTTYTDGDWQYVLDGTDAIITAYTGASVTTLTIPATVGGYSVKQVGNGTAVLSNYVYNLVISNGIESIGDYAFQDSDIYDSISFPSSLKSIGDYAFAGCECEGSLNMGGTQLVTIGEHAFDQCDKFNGTLTLPSTLTTIGDYAFQSCWRLTGALIIPASVTSIGNHAFNICQGFTSLTLNSGIQTIGESAFETCDSMTGTLTIPASVTSIGDYAFGDCDFDKVIVNSQSPNVGSYAFDFDPYGEKDTIVTVVNNSVLDLSNPNYGLHNAVFEVNGWQYKIIWELSGGEYTSKYAIVIHHDPFTDVSVTIPSSVVSGTVTYDVKQIGDGESAIATIINSTLVIPNSIERINDNAFMNTGLTGTLIIPSNVTEIGSEAFKGCSDLINLIVLSNPTVGTDAFANTGIKEVLNLGTTEFTKTSYGLNADEVRTDIQADGCIAIIHDVQEKKDIVSTLMKILPILILMVILVLIARPLFGMDEDDDDESGSGSDDYEYY